MNKTNLESAIALRRELHQHPELSNEEVWTKQHLIEFLQKNTTNIEIIDKGEWFYAAYRVGKDKKNIAFRADYDALPMDEVIDIPWGSQFPGKAHKCGHDGHSATLAAFALEVDQKGAEHNIFFLFQPAEEVGAGALKCLPLIEEEKVDEIYGYHNMSGMPAHSINIMKGVTQCASTGMIIKMVGAPAHASQPETGVNPAFAIANIIQSIPELTKESDGILLCTVIQVDIGERAFGMSASKGELLLTLRALYEDEMTALRDSLIDLANQEAEKYGLTVSFEYSDTFPETRNHDESVDVIMNVAKEKGYVVNEMDKPFRGSEDYGHYTKLTKGAFCFIGNGEDHPPVHTSAYDFRDDLIEVACDLFKGISGTN
ncbi:M20 family metallopeptidase [Ornithinibacillus sp. 4-3]|uniref:M20 family metallopeptidase n=1 Tax=Ornithinibacillus sp. 4-3 TaxID=3231488 RepID=A0AB39HVL0_9BACI